MTQSPAQRQRAVHFSAALLHLHRPVQPFLQRHLISSAQEDAASGIVVQSGCHWPASFVHPQSVGSGRSGVFSSA